MNTYLLDQFISYIFSAVSGTGATPVFNNYPSLSTYILKLIYRWSIDKADLNNFIDNTGGHNGCII